METYSKTHLSARAKLCPLMKRACSKVVAGLAEGQPIWVVGRVAETLLILIQKESEGVRAYDFAGGPPFRRGAYVHDLRRMGLAIRTAARGRRPWLLRPGEPCDRPPDPSC
jgi:hypothetical protein